MNKVIELLRQLQADSLVLFVKTHNFHWNVRGSDFYQVHSATEEIYENFASMFDDLAERIVQLGEKPVVTLQDALQHSKIKEESKTNFYSKEIFSAIIKDYEYLLENFVALSNLADESKDKTTVAYADEQVAKLQKSLWMLRATQA
ncbi:DNA starvation/stationary phase protection protein [Helicobacter anseris]|uniref:DNA starvation/stationary phase protection protein n=1 Tax=Helicobacter anseris TaxID=375926 RepID=A0A3D8J722_9HELI|nr:Dps family protein [Helicobacter anseris]RDU73293.1 DNA starvation/stationary phase protection protein [Helicobacter anseris]